LSPLRTVNRGHKKTTAHSCEAGSLIKYLSLFEKYDHTNTTHQSLSRCDDGDVYDEVYSKFCFLISKLRHKSRQSESKSKAVSKN